MVAALESLKGLQAGLDARSLAGVRPGCVHACQIAVQQMLLSPTAPFTLCAPPDLDCAEPSCWPASSASRACLLQRRRGCILGHARARAAVHAPTAGAATRAAASHSPATHSPADHRTRCAALTPGEHWTVRADALDTIPMQDLVADSCIETLLATFAGSCSLHRGLLWLRAPGKDVAPSCWLSQAL